MGAIKALERLAQPTVVRLHTDSTYVRDGVTKWLARWKRNGWQTTGGQPVKNVDLWRRLDAAVQAHVVQLHWVKGHAGHPDNERADQLAAEGLRAALSDASAYRRSVSRTGPVPTIDTAVRTPDEVRESPEGSRMSTSGGQVRPLPAVSLGLGDHDRLVQCGVEKEDGQPCRSVTGGGPCGLHQDGAYEELVLF